MIKQHLITPLDILRVVSVLFVTILVSIFIAPRAPWILVISVASSVYVIAMEFIKYFLGIKQIREGKHTDIVSYERDY